MNKKGQLNWILGILGIIILIAGIVILFVVINQGNKQEQVLTMNPMNVYLIARSSYNRNSIEGNYTISNASLYSSGIILKDSFTELNNVLSNESMNVLCSSDGYYATSFNHPFSSADINSNSSKIDCLLDKKGTIMAFHDGKLKEGFSAIQLIIHSNGYYKNVTVCASWTGGIISLDLQNEIKEEIPKRYNSLVDKCFKLDKDMKDEVIKLNFTVKGENLNTLDKVTFYIFDKDWIYTDKFEQLSEYKNMNLGNEGDTIYELKFE